MIELSSSPVMIKLGCMRYALATGIKGVGINFWVPVAFYMLDGNAIGGVWRVAELYQQGRRAIWSVWC